MTTAIAAAVLPLRQTALDRAAQEAQMVIDWCHAQLEEHGWDLELAAPYPRSFHESRENYNRKLARRRLIESVTTYAKSSRSSREPNIRLKSEDKEASFIEAAKQNAGAQYDAFIGKLEAKVGEHSEAVLSGNHVWGHSILTVTTPNGVERWKTQTIINQSKLGTIFNQFPTRKIK